MEELGVETCGDGIHIFSKVLSAIFILLIAVQLFRVGSGHIHKNLVYVCSNPLVESDFRFCTSLNWTNVMSIVTVACGSFLMPFHDLCRCTVERVERSMAKEKVNVFEMRQDERVYLQKEVDETTSALDEEHVRGIRAVTNILRVILKVLSVTYYKVFGMGYVLCTTLNKLKSMEEHEAGGIVAEIRKKPMGALEIGGVSMEEWLDGWREHNAATAAHIKSKNACWRILKHSSFLMKSVVKSIIGLFDTPVMGSQRALGRSLIWDAQMESVQLASGNYYGISIQIIPFIGVFIGKVCMYLNEHPTWCRSKHPAFGERSVRWNVEKQELRPSNRMKALYAMSVIKVSLLFFAFYSGKIVFFVFIFVAALLEQVIAAVMKEHNRFESAVIHPDPDEVREAWGPDETNQREDESPRTPR